MTTHRTRIKEAFKTIRRNGGVARMRDWGTDLDQSGATTVAYITPDERDYLFRVYDGTLMDSLLIHWAAPNDDPAEIIAALRAEGLQVKWDGGGYAIEVLTGYSIPEGASNIGERDESIENLLFA